MVIKLNKRILERDISSFLRKSLIDKFNYVNNKEEPSILDIKHLAYHAIAYFQYLNLLRINQAIALYKDYILSNGHKDKLVDIIYYNDGIEKKIKKNEIIIPLYFDDLLKYVSKYLMNYKEIVRGVLTDSYKKYFRKKFHLNPSDITLYAIINLLENIGLYSLKALKEHWTIINKEILPFLLEKSRVIETKD
jgi:hypothetical protein